MDKAAQVLADVLNRERDTFNARFVLARSKWRALSAREWTLVLQESVAPVVFATQQVLESRAEAVAAAAFETALELLARDYLGPRSDGSMAVLWRKILPQIAPIVAANPRRALSRASNALLSVQAHHRGEVWLERLGFLAKSGAFAACDEEQFEHALLVLAWRCGLAHARESALKYLRALPFALASALLGAASVEARDWPNLLARLEHEPFFDPSRPDAGAELRLVAQVGDWEAWGGVMSAPPRVARRRGALWAWSGRLWWRLHADAFGATLSPSRTQIPPENLPAPWQRDESCGFWKLQAEPPQRGQRAALHVTQGPNPAYAQGSATRLDGFGEILSAASDEHLLAFTTPLSMRVFVVARASST